MEKKISSVAILFILLSCFMLQGCGMDGVINKMFQEKELTAEDIYEMVLPSVVEVTAESATMTSGGTGFFYDDKGTIITNYHVIEKCTSAKITTSDGEVYEVEKVLGYSESRDIAILATTCSSSVPLQMRKSEVKTGETVYAIGSSLGLTGSLSDGIVSSANRDVDGQMFIQITAPISHGNSGGPLLDSKGRVIGITTASFADGQNLNLAIPISDIDNVSTKTPTTLVEMFPRNVEWISERDFFYYEDYDKFVFVFKLSDEEEVAMFSSGTAEVRIVNDDGVTVYDNKHTFTESDYEEWTYNGTIEKILASIYISPDDITPGTSEKGKIYFTVYGEDYYFDEAYLTAENLPTIPLQVTLPKLPQKVHYYSYSGSIYTTVRIDSITYEVKYDDSLYVYFTGEKTYDSNGNNSESTCYFRWKLYDGAGYLIDSGIISVSNLKVGDKFRGAEGYAFDCIDLDMSYKIVIESY